MPHQLHEGDILVKEPVEGRFSVFIHREGHWAVLGQWSQDDLRTSCERYHLVLLEARPADAIYTGVYRKEQKKG